jgi:F-type H+-transporting ATPase subunit a
VDSKYLADNREAENTEPLEALGNVASDSINYEGEFQPIDGDFVETPVDISNEQAEDNPINELLGELGDHSGFNVFNFKLFQLPVIIYDDGLHFYSSPYSMEDAGLYEMVEVNGHKHIEKVGVDPEDAHIMDFSPTNFVFFQWIAMVLIIGLVFKAKSSAKKIKKDEAPRGILSMFEASWTFIRQGILGPNIPSRKAADRLTPYFYTLFIFIFVMNLLGLIPGGHTATASLGVAGALAITAFFVINYTAIKESGIGAWFHHLLGGAPWWLAPLMIPIEIMSLFIKPFALMVRLFANMTAGHVVLFALLGLIFVFKSAIVGGGVVVFSLFIYLLELLVAFLQAYIFTMLTAIFTGLAIGEHGHEEHAH